MKVHITTIFDKNYLVRAIAFRESLYQYAPNAMVYMLCLDEEAFSMINKLELRETEVLKAEDLSDENLLATKHGRTLPEFASTCKPALLKYILNSERIGEDDFLAFIDPDILFYSDSKSIFENIHKSGSITITPHRFSTKRKEEQYKKGVYNAGMVFFKNNSDSITCIEEWRKQCIDWCYIRYEDGKIGDQGYLSDWPKKYKNVYVLEHKGINLGSWNIENYKIKKKSNNFMIDEDILICYHFHGLKIYLNQSKSIRALPITILNKSIYNTYTDKLNLAYKKILSIDPLWIFGFINHPGIIRIIKQKAFKLMGI